MLKAIKQTCIQIKFNTSKVFKILNYKIEIPKSYNKEFDNVYKQIEQNINCP